MDNKKLAEKLKGAKREDNGSWGITGPLEWYDYEIVEEVISVLESGASVTNVVCLVGSVKQEDDWRAEAARLTALGYVVLEAGLYGTAGKDIPQETWDLVTKVHFQKIEMADVVGVIRKPDGTVGNDTQVDIAHAKGCSIRVMDSKMITAPAKESVA